MIASDCDDKPKLISLAERQHRKYHRAGVVSKIARDPEVMALIEDHTPRLPYKKIAAICKLRVGPDRAPSKSSIGRYWYQRMKEMGIVRPNWLAKIEGNPEIKKYIDENLDICTFLELAEKCREKFGTKNAPGRSAIHRYYRRKLINEQFPD